MTEGSSTRNKQRLEEQEIYFSRPQLHPDLYVPIQEMVKRDGSLDAAKKLIQTPEFNRVRKFTRKTVRVILTSVEKMLRAKGVLLEVENKPNLNIRNRLQQVLNYLDSPILTSAEEEKLNNIFYQAVVQEYQDQGLQLPQDYRECENLYNYWAGKADELFQDWIPQEVVKEQPLTLHEEVRGAPPYKLILLTKESGEKGFVAGRKCAFVMIGLEVNQLFSETGIVRVDDALDTGVQREINRLLSRLYQEGVLVKDDSGRRTEEVRITCFRDPKDKYRAKIISYQNPQGEPETVFALSSGEELKVEISLETLKSQVMPLVAGEEEVTEDMWQQAINNFFKTKHWRESLGALLAQEIENKKERDSVFKEVVELLCQASQNFLIRAELTRECRLLRTKTGFVYVIVAPREKRSLAILIKAIRRGYKDISKIQDIVGIAFVFLNTEDAQKGSLVIEGALDVDTRGFDIVDNLIKIQEGERADAYTSPEARFRSFKILFDGAGEDGRVRPQIPTEVQELTFLAKEQGIGLAEHKLYRLRQVLGSFLRVVFPPQFFGERFNVAERLAEVKDYYRDELDIYNEEVYQKLKAVYEREVQEHKTGNYPYDFTEYIGKVYTPQFLAKKLFYVIQERVKSADGQSRIIYKPQGLLSLTKDQIEQHSLRETIIALKRLRHIVESKMKRIVEDKVMEGVDRSSPSWIEIGHGRAEECIVQQASMDFILDFLRLVSQENK